MKSNSASFVYILSICLMVCSCTTLADAELSHWITVPTNALISEIVTSSLLSYYDERPFTLYSYRYLRQLVNPTDWEEFRGYLPGILYLTALAESTYLVGEGMGEKGSVIPAWVGPSVHPPQPG